KTAIWQVLQVFLLIILMKTGNCGVCQSLTGKLPKNKLMLGGLKGYVPVWLYVMRYDLIISGHFHPIGKCQQEKLQRRMGNGKPVLARIFSGFWKKSLAHCLL